MPAPTLFDRLKQRALDVVDAAERLCLALPRRSPLEEECFHAGARLLRCVTLLDERPCAAWALDELCGRVARLLSVVAAAREQGLVSAGQTADALSLCEDLLDMARSLRGGDVAREHDALVTSRRPPTLFG